MNDAKGWAAIGLISLFLIFPIKSSSAQEQGSAKSDVLINRLKVITKENDRLKQMVEAYEKQLAYLEDQNNKTAQTIKMLQDRLASEPAASQAAAPSSDADTSRLTKELADAHYNLGVMYQEQGKNDDAINEYKRVLMAKPDDAEAHYNLGLIYDTVKHDKAEALYYYRKYLELSPNASDKAEIQNQIDKLLD